MTAITEKMCPFLSSVTVKDGEATKCQGQMCAMFMPIVDDTTKKVMGGNCAFALNAIALSNINVNTVKLGDHFAPGVLNPMLVKG